MQDDIYKQVRKRVKQKSGFYKHLTSYLVIGTFFLVLNILTSPGEWWFFFPMLGWGIGLAMHFFSVFGLPGSGIGSKEWEERKVEEEMRRMGRYQEPMPKSEDEKLDLDEPEMRSEARRHYRDEDLV
jgi:hypothetical protein